MSFAWLKSYMPRSLYGRAALILVLPVVTLQLVVSVVFIQRHFEGVTEQMTRSVSSELALLLDVAAEAGSATEAVAEISPLASALGYQARFAAGSEIPAADYRRWYDFSGIVVRRVLDERVPEVVRLMLPDDRNVTLFAETPHGPLRIEFRRTRVSASNPHQLLVNMLVFGVLMTVIAFLYLRNQLRPVTRLGRVAEAFGRGQHLPYNPSGAVEVRAAGNAFLNMRSRIERQIEQRTMMLSGVSHDLRTPLTRMRLELSMLDEAETEGLKRDVDEMERLLEEFLSFAKGASEGETELVDPQELVQELVADMVRSGAAVTLLPPEGAGRLRLRPVAIRRAVGNLLTNSVRYGERAEVSVRITDKSLRIRVDDDGPGIPEDRRDEAKKPFARLDPARNQNRGSGVGLGLAIATDIARSHGGVLRLGQSDTLGGLRAEIVIGR